MQKRNKKHPLSNFKYILEQHPLTLKACGGKLTVRMFHEEFKRRGYTTKITTVHQHVREGISSLNTASVYAEVMCYSFGINLHPKEFIGIYAKNYTEVEQIKKRYKIFDIKENQKDQKVLNDWGNYI